MKSKIAFLDDYNILKPNTEGWDVIPLLRNVSDYRGVSVSQLWREAEYLYMLPSCSVGAMRFLPEHPFTARGFGTVDQDGLAPVYAIAHEAQPHDETFVVLPTKLQAWDIDLYTAEDLLHFLTYYFALTGIVPVWTPGAAGLDILRKIKREAGQLTQLTAPSGDLSPWAHKPALDMQ